MKLCRITDMREIVVGDPVKFKGRPHYVQNIDYEKGVISVISMCERRYIETCKPEHIDCLIYKKTQKGACVEEDGMI